MRKGFAALLFLVLGCGLALAGNDAPPAECGLFVTDGEFDSQRYLEAYQEAGMDMDDMIASPVATFDFPDCPRTSCEWGPPVCLLDLNTSRWYDTGLHACKVSESHAITCGTKTVHRQDFACVYSEGGGSCGWTGGIFACM